MGSERLKRYWGYHVQHMSPHNSPADKLSQKHTQHRTDPVSCFAFTIQQLAFPSLCVSHPLFHYQKVSSPPHSSKPHSFLWSHHTSLQWKWNFIVKYKKKESSRATKWKATIHWAEQKGCPKLQFQLLMLKGTSQAPLNRAISKPRE